MELVRDRLVAVLMNLAKCAQKHTALAMVGRSHNTPAQATTLGKRFASAGTEVMVAFARLEELIARYALRGVRGPMGTSQDQLELLDGDREAHKVLEAAVVEHLGFSASLGSTGQVYPRSMDYEVATAVAQVAAGPSSLATTLRLMAGFDLSNEGFKEGQVGSSAMPHKMNSRTCERICGFKTIIDGYVTMTAGLSGDQWQEGDVSCSVVRRVALPGLFFAIDGQLEALLTVLDEFGVYPAVIQRELDRYFPFLTTTKILAAAMKQQQGREEAYAAIQEHAKAVVLAMRESGFTENDFYQRLADDPRIDLSLFEILALIDAPLTFVGNAEQQTFDFYSGVNAILTRFSDEVITYHPAPIL
jgi:adenylosuccinate lyase